MQLRPDCLFGKVDAWFLKWETSGRGGLHDHGDVWQPDLSPSRLTKLLQNSDTRCHMTSFLESVCVMVAPGEGLLKADLRLPVTNTSAGYLRPHLPTGAR